MRTVAGSIQGCIQRLLDVLWLLHRQKRAPDYRRDREGARGRRGVAFWEGGGVDGRGRTGKERATHTRHGGNRNILGNVQFSQLFIHPLCLWISVNISLFLAPLALFSHGWVPPVVASQPAEDGWHWHALTELPVKTQHGRKELLLLLLKRGTTSGVVKSRGHTPVHKASGRWNGAIVLQLRASRDRSGARLISLRGSLQRGAEQLAHSVRDWGSCFRYTWVIYPASWC